MALTKTEKFLLEEVLTKVTYDTVLMKYIIRIDDYLPLNLTKKELRLLEEICQKNNIELEKIPQKIKYKEGEALLVEYHQLKKKIEANPEHLNKEHLIQKQIELKQRIAIGYMEVIYKLINKTLPNLDNEQDREDIYQIGYEVLLEFIDKYIPNTKTSFDKYIKQYAIRKILRNVIKINPKVTQTESDRLRQIRFAKSQIKNYDNREHLIRQLISLTGFTEEQVEGLLLIEEELEKEGLEKISQDILSETLQDPYDLEEDIVDKIIKENLVKLLDTLPQNQKEIIMLYYGFTDGIAHTLEEVTEILNYNNIERVRQIKNDALRNLRIPIYSIHIDNKDSSNESFENYLASKQPAYAKKRIKALEEILLMSLPEQILNELIEKLPSLPKTILELSFGLKDGISYNVKEISEMLNISILIVNKNKEIGINKIKYWLEKRIENPDKKGEYFKYLTQLYLSTPKRKS